MSDQERPQPLVPAVVDLRDFAFMPLDVRRFRDSRIVAVRSAEEVLAAVLLWSASWHQIPASSVPDDDIELAQLAGYGRAVKEWRKVRDGAFHGWICCSDGRWYHPVVAEKAAEAWNGRIELEHRRACDRQRKDNRERKERNDQELPMPPKPSLLAVRFSDGTPMWRVWNDRAIPPERPADSAGSPPDETRNSGLKGKGEGQGKGTGDSGQGKGKLTPKARFAAPEWVPPEPWAAFEAMRNRIRKPMTDRAKELVIIELDKLRAQGQEPAAVLEQSVRKSWQDVYPIGKQQGRSDLDQWTPPAELAR